MESLLVNTIVGFWLVAFGAMALVPLLIDSGTEASATGVAPDAPEDDQIISIQPVAVGRRPVAIDQHGIPGEQAPANAPAAMFPHRHAA